MRREPFRLRHRNLRGVVVHEKRAITTSGLLLLTLGSGPIQAAVTPPQEVVQDTSTRMLDALRKNRATIEREPSRIYELVDQIVLPNFDFELMSRWVLGRAWQQATPEQRRQFTEEFRTLLGPHLRQGAAGILRRNHPSAAASRRAGRR